MGCCASTSRKAPISARAVPTRLRPWRPPSTPGPERRLLGKHPQKRLTSCFNQTTKTVLRRPLESAQVMTKLGLTVNEAKTSVRDARKERFDFLGYSFGPHRYRKDGHWYLGASPSQKS